jgi:hypothetical protein
MAFKHPRQLVSLPAAGSVSGALAGIRLVAETPVGPAHPGGDGQASGQCGWLPHWPLAWTALIATLSSCSSAVSTTATVPACLWPWRANNRSALVASETQLDHLLAEGSDGEVEAVPLFKDLLRLES